MHYLITGATGFIGRNILDHLLFLNARITVLIRSHSKNKIVINNKKVNYILVDDLFDKNVSWWIDILNDIDCVIHSAWYTVPNVYLNSEKNFECLRGSLTILEAIRSSKVKFFVGLGTCFEYDFKFSNKPFKTSTPLNPKSPYTLSKVSLLNALKILQKTSDFNFAWCRVFYLYGLNEDRRRLIPYIHEKLANSEKVIIKNPNYVRDYLNVKEAGKLIAKIAVNSQYGEFNICSGKGKLIKDIALEIGEIYQKSHLIKFDNSSEIKNDPLMIVGELNFK